MAGIWRRFRHAKNPSPGQGKGASRSVGWVARGSIVVRREVALSENFAELAVGAAGVAELLPTQLWWTESCSK